MDEVLMIPDEVGPNTSDAEREIFNRIRAVEVPGLMYALHSLHLPEHERKRVAEADFVLAGRSGVFVLEVKGGAVSRRAGVWRFEDLRGRRRKLKESPFAQAEGVMFGLERSLRQTLGTELVGRTVFGYAAVFPHCDLTDVETVEWDSEIVVDRKCFTEDGGAAAFTRLCSYWKRKPPGDRSDLTDADVDRLLGNLRPDFERVLTLRQLSESVESQLVSLTERQYRGLDAYSHNERLLLEGGAGTGKTVLAVEICRRAAARGRSVLLTCRSAVLAGFLSEQDQLEGVVVRPFGRLQSLPAATFELVVVDEAQDVINPADLAVLDSLLKGGLSDGRWVFLLDTNNQRGLVGRYDEEAMRSLKATRPASVILNENCRNTTEIVRATQQRTGADLGVATAGRGPDVAIIEGGREYVARELAAVLDDLKDDDIPMEQVVMLSSHPFQNSVFATLPESWRGRIDALNLHRLRTARPGRIGFARVADFKGLESAFVLLEIDGSAPPEQIHAETYVGMTRPRVGLWIIGVDTSGDSVLAQS